MIASQKLIAGGFLYALLLFSLGIAYKDELANTFAKNIPFQTFKFGTDYEQFNAKREIVSAEPIFPCTKNAECGHGICNEHEEHQEVGSPNTTYTCKCKAGYVSVNKDGDVTSDVQPCEYKQKSGLASLLFSIFLGGFGADWFYLCRGDPGYIVAGIFKLLTGGGCFIWYIVDIIRIAVSAFPDGNGVALSAI